jgi:hypothetical protein
MGRLRQGAVQRPRGRTRLSLALHAPGRPLQSAPDRPRRDWRHLPLQRLPPRGSGAAARHDAHASRVHPALPAACSATGLPPHPPLRLARQLRTQARYCARPRTACRGFASGEARRSARAARLASTLSLLWRAHAHHRDVRALDAAARTAPRSHSDRDAVVTRHRKPSPNAATPVVPATASHAPFARTLTERLNTASGKLRCHRPPGAKSRSPHPPRLDRRPDAAMITFGKKPKSP